MGLVTGNFFEIMGLDPVVGRLTSPADDGTGVPPVMILTHDFWVRRFGGDSSIVGQQVALASGSATVIGVLQRAPSYPDHVDAFFNMVVSPHHLSAMMVTNRSHRMTQMVARLADGASVEQARTQVAAVHARVLHDNPGVYDSTSHYRVSLVPFQEALGEHAQLTLWLLMAAAVFVMIISAANVANLTLMRGVRREHELAVRAALGAGVARLRRLLLVENLLLALMGAILGVIIASAGVRLLTAFAARYSPRAGEIRLDIQVFGFALGLSVAVALILSFIAALPKEGAFASWIGAGGNRTSANAGKQRLQRGLVVVQVAASVVLLAGAGLLTRTMIRLADVRTGLTSEEVLTLPVPLLDVTRLGPAADAATKATYERMRLEIGALPGVTLVGVGSTMPLRSSMLGFDIKSESRPPVPGEPMVHGDFRAADPAYFRAAGIPLIEGRAFLGTDGAGTGKVVVVNQTLADRLFPGASPIGQRIALTSPILQFTPFTGEWRTIVGVVGNTQDGGLDAEPRAVLFVPFAQEFTVSGGLVIRADSNAAALATAATRIVRRIAPEAPIENVLTVSQIKAESVAPRRLNAALISSFGLLALIIASVGIAGVLAFSVSARTNEIGIRMSLGADGGRVQRMILREGGVLLAVGLALGVAGAFFATGVMRGLLFGIEPHDPATFIGVTAMMTAIGTLACWIPALRAARIDPAIAMRSA